MEIETPWKKLQQKWIQTKADWDDPVSIEFEQSFLVPLAEQIRHTQRELGKLIEFIIQAKRMIK